MVVGVRKEVIFKLNNMIEECEALNMRVEAHKNKREALTTSLDYKQVVEAHNQYLETLDSMMNLVERFFIVKDEELQRLTGMFDKLCNEFSVVFKNSGELCPRDLMEKYKRFEKEQSEIQAVIEKLQTYNLPIKKSK
ncbi:MAG: hypothetical protein ACRCX8_16600 [Sarcina sp.]